MDLYLLWEPSQWFVLELSGMGTVDVEVTTQRTIRVPLFDKDVSNNLFGCRTRDLEAFIEGAEEDQQGLPAGFILLARTIMSVQRGQSTSIKASSRGCHGTFSTS